MNARAFALLALVLLAAAAGAAREPAAADSPAADTLAADTLAADTSRNLVRDSWHGVKTLAHDTGHILVSPLRMGKRDALQLGAILAATGVLMVFDEEIHAAFNRNAEEFPLQGMLEVGRFLDPVGYGSMNVYYLGGLGLSYLLRWEKGEAIFGEIITSFVVYGLLKVPVETLVGRARPYQDEGAYSFGNDDATSFFSGHTVNVFQLATVLSHNVDSTIFDVAAWFGAACVGCQRIEADAHWPSDVFLSAAFAIAVSRGAIALHEERQVAVRPTVGAEGVGMAVGWRF